MSKGEFVAARRRLMAGASAPALIDRRPASPLGVTPDITVNPKQTTTYDVRQSSNPIVFGIGTNIDAAPDSSGVDVKFSGLTMTNKGHIQGASYGVRLFFGGTLHNAAGGVIAGNPWGVFSEGDLTLTNAGTIDGTMVSWRGGDFSNLAGGVVTGEVSAGLLGGSAAITNAAGGHMLEGVVVYGDSKGVVTNSGTIASTGSGVALEAGGTVTNRHGGSIAGLDGVYAMGGPATISNAGSLEGGAGGAGVSLQAGGSVSNLAGGVIGGGTGIDLSAGGYVGNAGVINAGAVGVIAEGGSLVNQAGGRIKGSIGVAFTVAPATVVNAGSITGTGSYGISLADGGIVTNQLGGVVSGKSIGLTVFEDSGSLINAGTIVGTKQAGVKFVSGGNLANLATGLITGAYGVEMGASNTLVNAGTVTGAKGVGVSESAGELVNRANASVTGATDAVVVDGSFDAGGRVVNQVGGSIAGVTGGVRAIGGVATITNAGAISASASTGDGVSMVGGTLANAKTGSIGGPSVGVRISDGATAITNLGAIGADAASSTSLGVGVFGGGGSVVNRAGATIAGGHAGIYAVSVAIDITNAGAVTAALGDGVSLYQGGSVANSAGGRIAGESGVFVKGAAGALTNAGRITGSSGDGVVLAHGGTVANLAGGLISGTRYGVELSGPAGTITNAGKISGGTDAVLFAGYGANRLVLQTGSALLGKVVGSTTEGATNTLALQGSGLSNNAFLNFTALNVGAKATWTLDAASTFGAAVIAGGGTLQVGDATHAHARFTVSGALANSGVIEVGAGLVDVVGAVGGGGSAVIAGGALELDSTFTQNVTFTGASGMLRLARSQSYTGAIGGFSTTGGTSLDLRDIHISGKTTATFVDDGSHTGGVLTVTDGTHNAHISLIGDFSGSTFAVTGDGHGGTLVTGASTQGVSLAAKPRADTAIGSQTTTYTLKVGGNPFSVASGVTIQTTKGDAIDGPKGRSWTVANHGHLYGYLIGLQLVSGGTVTNTGVMQGDRSAGLVIGGNASVTNSGVISSLQLDAVGLAGGKFTNLAGGQVTGQFDGLYSSGLNALQVDNAGTITGNNGFGISLDSVGSSITNNKTGLIQSDNGAAVELYGSGASITNAGLISGDGGIEAVGDDTVVVNAAGGVIDVAQVGVSTSGHASTATIANFGTISGAVGVYLIAGGALTNRDGGTISGSLWGVESGADNEGVAASIYNTVGGLITGVAAGVYAPHHTASITNAGVISGTGASAVGIQFLYGGSILNQSGASVTGPADGVLVRGGAGTVTNAGKISGAGGDGVSLLAGGSLINKAGATIGGQVGVDIAGASGSVTNNGKIAATSAGGVVMGDGGSVINQPHGDISSVQNGVHIAGGAGQVVNAGTITGMKANGVTLLHGGAVTNKTGALISGGAYGVQVVGQAGTIANDGLISGGQVGIGLGAAGGSIANASGATIEGYTFGVVLKGRGGVTNSGDIGGSYSYGVFDKAGANVTNSGKIGGGGIGVDLVNGGKVTNLAGGEIDGEFAPGNAKYLQIGVNFDNGGTLINEAGGTISGGFVGVELTSSSAKAAVIHNAGTITADYASNYAVLFQGAGANTLVLQTGSVLVGEVAGSQSAGAANAMILQGSGQADNQFLNFNTLAVQSAGVWALDGASTFGAAAIAHGTLQVGDTSHASAKLVVSGALTNNGVIDVGGGLIDVVGAVSGTGSAQIAGGTLQFGSTFAENVAFTGATGVLDLAQSQAFSGVISGFSLTGGTSLDLRDIHFAKGLTKATYVDNGAHSGGVLTVVFGPHKAQIHFAGDYSGATFTLTGDGHGGTIVSDAPQSAAAAARPGVSSVLPFIAAIASLDTGAAHWTPTADTGRPASLLVATHSRE